MLQSFDYFCHLILLLFFTNKITVFEPTLALGQGVNVIKCMVNFLGIKIYRTPMFLNECDDGTDKWGFDGIYPEPEKIVKVFSWAQWDCVNQVSY